MSLSRSNYTNTLERQLSIEETYALANTARRKSSSGSARNDLRQKLGHAQVLEIVENVIRSSPPPSPKQSARAASTTRHITWRELEVEKTYTPPVQPAEEYDEYGFAYDDGEEDLNGLSLMRTQSRRD